MKINSNIRSLQVNLNEFYNNLLPMSIPIGFSEYDRLLALLAINHSNEHSCIIGAPGIGKSSLLRFTANLFANKYKVTYYSFGSVLQELLQSFELDIKNISKSKVVYDSYFINSIYQTYYLENAKTELLDEFIKFEETSKNFADSNLLIQDINYCSTHYDVLNQIEETLRLNSENKFQVLAIDNVDLIKLLALETEDLRIDEFILGLRHVCKQYNCKLITTSTIPFSRINTAHCLPTHWLQVNGGKGLIDSAEQVVFISRENYYYENVDTNKTALTLIKNRTIVDYFNQIELLYDNKNRVYFLNS